MHEAETIWNYCHINVCVTTKCYKSELKANTCLFIFIGE